jgi:hypothetical protein
MRLQVRAVGGFADFTMNRHRPTNPLTPVLWVNAILLALILVTLWTQRSTPSLSNEAIAQIQQPIAGGGGLFVMPTQLSTNTWGAYLMDIDAQTLMVYQFYPAEKQLRLMAARNFRFDRRLGNFNTTPDPREVQMLVQREQETNRVLDQNRQPVNPETPPKD